MNAKVLLLFSGLLIVSAAHHAYLAGLVADVGPGAVWSDDGTHLSKEGVDEVIGRVKWLKLNIALYITIVGGSGLLVFVWVLFVYFLQWARSRKELPQSHDP